jgi:hypothetical protein
MSASRNPEAMTSAQGEFHIRVPPSEPLTTKGHAPGVKVGNDAYPEFHAETYPPGTAPKENLFQPQPFSEVPGQANNPDASVRTDALDLPGATSADVDKGLGHPVSGMTSKDLHDNRRKGDGRGLIGVGVNASDPQHKYHHDREYETGVRGKGGANVYDYPTAENQVPVSAEHVASER